MSSSGLVVFVAAYVLAAALPGPAVAAIVARTLASGTGGAWAFIAGCAIGDLLWFVIAAAGLSAIASTFAGVFLVVKYAGAAYLLFIAYRLWAAPVTPRSLRADPVPERPARQFASGLALSLGNPKVIGFFLALLPSLLDLASLTVANVAVVAATILFVLPAVLGAYALAAGQARRFFQSASALRRLNRATGLVMAGAAIAVAAR